MLLDCLVIFLRERRVKRFSTCYKFSLPVKQELSECSVTVIVIHHMHLENSSVASASVTGAVAEVRLLNRDPYKRKS